MKKFPWIGIGIACLAFSAKGWTAPVTYKDFQAGSTLVGTQKVVFRLFVPKGYTPSKSYPIMVTLHGAGERGVDDSIQLTHYFNRMWADSAAQAIRPSFVLAPQCPAGNQWVNTPWGNGSYDFSSKPISVPMQAVVNILDSLGKRYSLDPTRYYASGISMGGYGTWYLAMNFPDKFAAVVPVCGAGDPFKAPAISKLPVWAFHAADDPVVPVAGSRDMISALEKAGGTPKYTEYPASQKVGHGSWEPASQNPALIPWVLSQSRTVVAVESVPRAKSGAGELRSGGWQFLNGVLLTPAGTGMALQVDGMGRLRAVK